MPTQKAEVYWEGDLEHGVGTIHVSSDTFEGDLPFGTRFGEEQDAEQGEMVGVALAQCYTTALVKALENDGFAPHRVLTFATVFPVPEGNKSRVAGIALTCEADVPLIEHRDFENLAHAALKSCSVGHSLEGTPIELDAILVTEVCAEPRMRGDFERVRTRS